MNEADFYKLNLGEFIKIDRAYNFFIGLEEKGYSLLDLGSSDPESVKINGVKYNFYNFNEIDKIPVKPFLQKVRDSLESKLEKEVKNVKK